MSIAAKLPNFINVRHGTEFLSVKFLARALIKPHLKPPQINSGCAGRYQLFRALYARPLIAWLSNLSMSLLALLSTCF